ncbi:hypothetical protein NGRA_0285 [Nosema granulosis]|uniref:Integrase zinc-binding domain-containing protein n=1 Tax=Nosema granulosis TaxID=83296 RepID=A0A9P6L0H4_9MICR|nr:hypothetical protein NGRA_0285 [Nosema granulosis]
MKQKWYWAGMKDQINRILKECETCNINNRKTTGGCNFVVTRKKLEKDALDIGNENRYVLVGIDYFTRRLWGARLKSKETKSVLEVLQKWISEDGFLKSMLRTMVKNL